MPKTVFISYCRRNIYYAQQLADDLTKLGCQVWLDHRNIPVYTKWMSQIEIGIQSHEHFVLLWSPEAAHSSFVKTEYELAKKLARNILPLVINGNADDMNDDLKQFQHLEAKRGYEEGLGKILKHLKVDPGKLKSHAQSLRDSSPLTVDSGVLDIPDLTSWRVRDSTTNNGASLEREFAKIPLLVSAYSRTSVVAESKSTLQGLSDAQIVLNFTGPDQRDVVKQVLQYLISQKLQPRILLVEGPQNDDAKYDIPLDARHVWADCISACSNAVEMFVGDGSPQIFLHSPAAFSFAVASNLMARRSFSVYQHRDANAAGSRLYACVFSKSSASN